MMIIKRLGLAGALMGTLAFGACSTTGSLLGQNDQTWTMETASTVPAAVGKVEVATNNKEGNRELKVETKHLAPADAAFPGTSTYVVWLKPSDGKAINIGVLSPDKDLNAELQTKTPFTNFQIKVTAENTAQPTTPSSHEVMSASVVLPS